MELVDEKLTHFCPITFAQGDRQGKLDCKVKCCFKAAPKEKVPEERETKSELSELTHQPMCDFSDIFISVIFLLYFCLFSRMGLSFALLAAFYLCCLKSILQSKLAAKRRKLSINSRPSVCCFGFNVHTTRPGLTVPATQRVASDGHNILRASSCKTVEGLGLSLSATWQSNCT